jgi:ethanolamine utilization protein EutP (predicted NTPase)
MILQKVNNNYSAEAMEDKKQFNKKAGLLKSRSIIGRVNKVDFMNDDLVSIAKQNLTKVSYQELSV